MKVDTKSRYITPADRNIFDDLGFAPEEAATLNAESDKIIAEKMAKADMDAQNLAKETNLEGIEKSLLERTVR